MAVQDIEADTTLFTIPRDMVMTMETSKISQTPELKVVFSRAAEDAGEMVEDSKPDGWSKLILVMVYEYLLEGESKWKPYFDVIPETFETPMFWSEAEVEQLQASALRKKIGKDSAEAMFRQTVLPHIRKSPNTFRSSEKASDQDLIKVCHRMGSAIMAYAFDLEDNDDEEEGGDNEDGWMEDRESEGLMGMVPMADMMNADAEFNAHVNHEEHALVVTALRPIKKGEEVLNYYGPHPNSELLRRYGYVTPKHARYDVVEIPWHLVQNVLQQQLNVAETTMGKIVSHAPPPDSDPPSFRRAQELTNASVRSSMSLSLRTHLCWNVRRASLTRRASSPNRRGSHLCPRTSWISSSQL